jgi:ADP-heptose:LPS heptosyltransferase
MKKTVIRPASKRILIFFNSNFGDVIMTLPVVAAIVQQVPQASIDCIVDQKTADFVSGIRHFHSVTVYNKKGGLREKCDFFFALRKKKYDFVIDFRGTLLPYLLARPHRSLSLYAGLRTIPSRYCRYQKMIELLGLPKPDLARFHLYTSLDCERLSSLLRTKGIYSMQNILVVAPGARSALKRWPARCFADVIQKLCARYDCTVVLSGDAGDRDACKEVAAGVDAAVCIDLAGKLTAGQFVFLIERARLVLSNDSAAMHVAHFYSRPVIGIFGPTDTSKYGFSSETARIASPDVASDALAKMTASEKHAAFAVLDPERVLSLARELLDGRLSEGNPSDEDTPRA